MKKSMFGVFAGLAVCAAVLLPPSVPASEAATDDVLASVRGTVVTWYGYGGSDTNNTYIDHFIAPRVKSKYGITLKRVGMGIDMILNNLTNSVMSGEKKGPVDVIWINGENFYTARKYGLLYGPFTADLPNFNHYVDVESRGVKFDFGYPVEGFEAPYGRAELVLEYDSELLPPLRSADDILAAAKKYPGRLTYPALPDFIGSAFVRNIIYEKSGYEAVKDVDPRDKEAVREAVRPAMDFLRELKPYLWKEGRTYPNSATLLDNMFADGEVYFNISYNPMHASVMIEKGLYPESVRTSVFEKGSIGNTNFLAVAVNSGNKTGAMVVINEILSFDGQLRKYQNGELPVFDMRRLSLSEAEAVTSVPRGVATLTLDELSAHCVPELPADMVPVIEKIWEEEILGW